MNYTFILKSDIAVMIKGARMKWFGHVIRMDEAAAPTRFLFAAFWDHRAEVRPKLWLLDCLTHDLANNGVSDWEGPKTVENGGKLWQKAKLTQGYRPAATTAANSEDIFAQLIKEKYEGTMLHKLRLK